MRGRLQAIAPVALAAAMVLGTPASFPVVVPPEREPEEVNVPPVINPDCLAALCIFAEARGEPFEGQVAVGNVIRNRMERRYSSDGTVAGTVLKPFQFSWANTGDPQRVRVFQCDEEDERYQRAMKAWLASENVRQVGDSVLYHAHYVSPPWATAPTVRFFARHGAHLFYEVER